MRKETLLDLGIAFQVSVAFSILMFETAIPWDPSDAVLGHSGVAIWLVLCGLLLPNSTVKAGIAAFFSALSWPAAYWLNLQLFGYTPLPWERLLIWILPIVIMAVWMYAIQWKAEELGAYKLDYLIGKRRSGRGLAGQA